MRPPSLRRAPRNVRQDDNGDKQLNNALTV